VGGDLRLRFHRGHPRSALALVPDMLDRATLFRPALVSTATYWLLLATLVLGIPLLLGLALARAAVTDPSGVRYPPKSGGQHEQAVSNSLDVGIGD
jgi:hypothetical protein